MNFDILVYSLINDCRGLDPDDYVYDEMEVSAHLTKVHELSDNQKIQLFGELYSSCSKQVKDSMLKTILSDRGVVRDLHNTLTKIGGKLGTLVDSGSLMYLRGQQYSNPYNLMDTIGNINDIASVLNKNSKPNYPVSIDKLLDGEDHLVVSININKLAEVNSSITKTISDIKLKREQKKKAAQEKKKKSEITKKQKEIDRALQLLKSENIISANE